MSAIASLRASATVTLQRCVVAGLGCLLADSVQSFKTLSGLGIEQLRELSRLVGLREAMENEFIFEQGSMGSTFYIILLGEVQVLPCPRSPPLLSVPANIVHARVQLLLCCRRLPARPPVCGLRFSSSVQNCKTRRMTRRRRKRGE